MVGAGEALTKGDDGRRRRRRKAIDDGRWRWRRRWQKRRQDDNEHEKIRKTAEAQQARRSSGVGRKHAEKWGRSCLFFDEARRGGFYTRVGDMTSTLRGERVARKNEYERIRNLP